MNHASVSQRYCCDHFTKMLNTGEKSCVLKNQINSGINSTMVIETIVSSMICFTPQPPGWTTAC